MSLKIRGYRTQKSPPPSASGLPGRLNTHAPLENVDVRLGVYGASTDAQGLASLELPGGIYELVAWKAGYETLPRTVEVATDLMVQVEAVFSPEKDPDESQVWM